MNSTILFLSALVPILWLVISMGTSLLKAHTATFSVLLITLVLALTIWEMPVINAFSAALEGALLGLWPIMAVIISAIFMYKLLLFVLIIFTSPLIPEVSKLLDQVKTSITVYTGENPGQLSFKWLNSPGTLIFISAVIGGLVQGARIKEIIRVFAATLKQMTASIITVLSIVAASKVMSYSGMIGVIATVLVKATGSFFPLVSPMIGMLGTFVTGSDTSSNVLFGAFQKEVAISIGANPYWLAASNTAGATAGKMISPQSIAVATSSAGLAGYDGRILKNTAKFCIAYVIALGLIVYFFGRLYNTFGITVITILNL